MYALGQTTLYSIYMYSYRVCINLMLFLYERKIAGMEIGSLIPAARSAAQTSVGRIASQRMFRRHLEFDMFTTLSSTSLFILTAHYLEYVNRSLPSTQSSVFPKTHMCRHLRGPTYIDSNI